MYITKMNDGRYKATVDGPRDPVTGKRRQITRIRQKKSEAIKAVQDELNKRNSILGTWGVLEKENLSFRAVSQMFLDEYKKTAKISTYETRLRTMPALYRFFDNVPMKKITHKMVQNMIDELQFGDVDYSMSYIKSVKANFNMVAMYAVRNGIIETDPGANCYYNKPKRTIQHLEEDLTESPFITKEQIQLLLSELKSDRRAYKDSYEFFTLMYYTGLRPGEALALKINDIDLEKNEIKVTKTLFNKRESRFGHTLLPTKTGKSRIVPIPAKLKEILEPYIKRNREIKRLFSDIYKDEQFLFCGNDGDPYKHSNLTRRLQKAKMRADINVQCTPHTFRHAYATMLVESNVPVKVAQELLGHSSMNTTMNFYVHTTEKMKNEANENIQNHIENALNFDGETDNS